MSDGKPSRQLDPWAAFMMSVVGLGFLHVGRFRLLLWLMLSGLALMLLLSWTRWILLPAGIYVLLGAIALAFILALFLPTYIAWREKTAPVKFYNRWYFYVGWLVVTWILSELFVPFRDNVLGYGVLRVSADSMLPTLERSELFTVDTWRYRRQKPVIGEVAVFGSPEGHAFVKRIVGIPNDRIEIRDGELYRNGNAVAEPYLHEYLEGERFGRDAPAITLGPGEYYVLGDFRDQSRDSRTFGPISEEQLIGRAEYTVFSRRRLGPLNPK